MACFSGDDRLHFARQFEGFTRRFFFLKEAKRMKLVQSVGDSDFAGPLGAKLAKLARR